MDFNNFRDELKWVRVTSVSKSFLIMRLKSEAECSAMISPCTPYITMYVNVAHDTLRSTPNSADLFLSNPVSCGHPFPHQVAPGMMIGQVRANRPLAPTPPACPLVA